MKPCRACAAGAWGICARHEEVAEERVYGRDHNDSAADYEQERYERWLDRGEAS